MIGLGAIEMELGEMELGEMEPGRWAGPGGGDLTR